MNGGPQEETGSRAVSARARAIPESSTVAIADKASAMRRSGHSVCDFSAGRAAENSPAAACEAAVRALREGHTHQVEARGTPEYLTACAAKLARSNGITVDPAVNLIATLGCKQGLVLALLAAVDPGDEVLIEDPCFVSYAPTIHLLGAIPVRVPARASNHYRWIVEDLERAVTPKTRAILFCSPNNPTGVVHSEKDLEAIAKVATTHDLTVIADEIYEAVTWEGHNHLPIALLPGMADRTIGLMGLTKSYSMGGWRIGYAYAASAYISRMTTIQQHLMTCASSIAQAGAAVALSPEGTEAMKPVWRDWEDRCRYATSTLDGHPLLSASMPEGGFYAWVDIASTGLTSDEFCSRLLQQHRVTTIPGSSFGSSNDSKVRITCVRSWSELREGVSRIMAFTDELGGLAR